MTACPLSPGGQRERLLLAVMVVASEKSLSKEVIERRRRVMAASSMNKSWFCLHKAKGEACSLRASKPISHSAPTERCSPCYYVEAAVMAERLP